ncbi:MAG: tRNA (N6-threonylcarbamoyladenosine(37)-N6)-methyltransferase TrmO [Dictyoglomus sp. NZ13-RE01]|nr:MAG: tRNA (N6-threonylcarbamoyladenosine(37)-N6)-methyltransferase TrmO [Dictyoglomus sp. NZ13-RE01]
MREDIKLFPIGVIHSPYKERGLYQGRFSEEVSEIEVFDEYKEGLKDVETCSHLIILYWLHRARRDILLTHTPHDSEIHGVFATRSPNRPNPIGFCVVELLEIKGNILKVKGLDALNGTPLIDIKPYSSAIDAVENAKIGWYERRNRE